MPAPAMDATETFNLERLSETGTVGRPAGPSRGFSEPGTGQPHGADTGLSRPPRREPSTLHGLPQAVPSCCFRSPKETAQGVARQFWGRKGT